VALAVTGPDPRAGSRPADPSKRRPPGGRHGAGIADGRARGARGRQLVRSDRSAGRGERSRHTDPGSTATARLDGASTKKSHVGRALLFRSLEDGTVLVGATVENVGFDERPTVAGVGELIAIGGRPDAARLHQRFPFGESGAASVDTRRIAPHRSVDGTAQPDVCHRHYRNGVLLAPLTAGLVADTWLENRPDIRSMEFTRPGRLGDCSQGPTGGDPLLQLGARLNEGNWRLAPAAIASPQ